MSSVRSAETDTRRVSCKLTIAGHGAETFIIMCAETGVGIACGCLPGCKPLMNRLFPRYFATTNCSSNQYPRRWQHNHAKQIDDGESTQPTESLRSGSIRLTSPRATHSGTTTQSTALGRSASRQTQKFATSSSSSRLTQSTFTTTITAQPHLPPSTSRHTSRWGSIDINKSLPMRPTLPAVAARKSSAGGFRRSRGASRDLSIISNASTEMFILQGRDSESGRQSPEKKNDAWRG